MRIEALGLSAGYGRRTVIAGVDFCLAQGELVGLIGPNGAGKSTLLKSLSGILTPHEGAVTLDGRPLSAFSARERAQHIAFVPQTEPALFDFTVREVVLMGRYAHRAGLKGETAKDHDEATRAMSAADTLHLADRPITSLSGGEHRRALLARALAQQAPLMLLDEPTAHLDITHQAELLGLLRRLTRAGSLGALVALHDVNTAADYCDRIVLLAGGRIAADGLPAEAITSEGLSRAYGTDLKVARNPATGRPLMVAQTPLVDGGPGERIHVICGGGSGVEVLSALHRRGYSLSTGVLNRLDSDEQAATVLGIPAALEAPFSPIGETALEAAIGLMQEARVVVVTAMPIGRGNLANLQIAREAALAGKPVFLLGKAPDDRDFADGEGVTRWRDLLDRGAVGVEGLSELEARLATLAIGETDA